MHADLSYGQVMLASGGLWGTNRDGVFSSKDTSYFRVSLIK